MEAIMKRLGEMDQPQCPICEATDPDIIRSCELRGYRECIATAYPLPTATTPPLQPTPKRWQERR